MKRRFLILFAVFVVPWSAGDALLWLHNSIPNGIATWDTVCWAAVIWTYFQLYPFKEKR